MWAVLTAVVGGIAYNIIESSVTPPILRFIANAPNANQLADDVRRLEGENAALYAQKRSLLSSIREASSRNVGLLAERESMKESLVELTGKLANRGVDVNWISVPFMTRNDCMAHLEKWAVDNKANINSV